ncbi:MAG: amino acid permease, partial [Terriglobales bacterium]
MSPGTNNEGSDREHLARFGYRPQLQRAMGLTSSFALSFSVFSVSTGLFANYAEGLRLAGPSFIWTWPLVGAGQFLVALVFAHLARQIPVSGYAHQWTRELAGPRLARWTGWMMIIQFLTGMPGVCYSFANYLLPYLGLPQENRWV